MKVNQTPNLRNNRVKNKVQKEISHIDFFKKKIVTFFSSCARECNAVTLVDIGSQLLTEMAKNGSKVRFPADPNKKPTFWTFSLRIMLGSRNLFRQSVSGGPLMWFEL
jgi:hypothetical protein